MTTDYPEDFINKSFKEVMDNIHVVKETILTVIPCFNILTI